jgi:hypothetical protein
MALGSVAVAVLLRFEVHFREKHPLASSAHLFRSGLSSCWSPAVTNYSAMCCRLSPVHMALEFLIELTQTATSWLSVYIQPNALSGTRSPQGVFFMGCRSL